MRRDRRDGAENDEMMRNAECDVKPGLGLRRPATTCPRQPCSHPRPLEIFTGCAPCCAWALPARIRCRRGTNPPIGLRRPSARPAPRHASPLFRLARLCGMQRIRLCVKRIVRNAEQRRNADATRCDEIGEALRNRDCAECYEIGEIVRNATRWRNSYYATRLARFCGIMIVWNAECNAMDEILLCMDCAECGLCGMQRDRRDYAE